MFSVWIGVKGAKITYKKVLKSGVIHIYKRVACKFFLLFHFFQKVKSKLIFR